MIEPRSRPEWTDVPLGGNHRLTVSLLGERIILSQPTGFTSLESLIGALDLVRTVVDSAMPKRQPFVWIADYSRLDGVSREARKHFAEATADWPQLHTLILCGLSPILTVAARLATKLRLVKYDVVFAGNLEEAIGIAEHVVEETRDWEDSSSPEVLESKNWRVRLDGLSVWMDVHDGNILHAVARGKLAEQHVDPIFELHETVYRTSELDRGPYSMMIGLGNLDGITYRARQRYLAEMTKWFQARPFNVAVFYEASPVLRAALNLSRAFAPFNAKMTTSVQDALEVIRQFGDSDGAPKSPAKSRRSGRSDDPKIRRYVDELLEVLSAVNWDIETEHGDPHFEPSHPFTPVFEAIELLRTELQELLEERGHAEKEQRLLQEKLARARKMEALGLLAGGVAHDLNNVLSGIVTYPDFLLMDNSLDPETRETLETIKKSGEQAAAIVNDLVTIARGVAVNTQPVLLDDVVSDYLSSPQFKRLNEFHPWVRVKTGLNCEGAAVTGSPVHLKKIVMNLVSNAAEAIPEDAGEGCVRIETSFKYVDRRVHGLDDVEEGEYSVLSVIDDGPGIPFKELDRVFEPFFTKKVMGRSGTGLGLTVVWNTVQDHGGQIDVSSSEEGTRFDIYFPVTRDEVEAVEQKVPITEYRGNGERVLIVDDIMSQREIAARMLSGLGYEVATAAGGEEAVEYLASHPVDIVLLDMIMDPGINGRETYERIVQKHPGQKAVITSGFSENSEVARAQSLGAGAFVSKPYSIEKIGLALRQELDR